MEDKILIILLIALIPLMVMSLRDREKFSFALAGLFVGVVVAAIAFGLTIWKIYEEKNYTEKIQKAIQNNKPLLCKDTIVRNPVLIKDKQIVLDKEKDKAFSITDCEVFEKE
ncbi:hypothetical protein [Persephonella sp. KM09-Lau-8]|uniref:hypothetical protein n=1 Tax=Persephonella sp. KM09-Lau-8 TaxID=1158345 RepID=UPI00049868EE|nr:hypothetical protein [Persephonella sp. KM09-Lau-8]